MWFKKHISHFKMMCFILVVKQILMSILLPLMLSHSEYFPKSLSHTLGIRELCLKCGICFRFSFDLGPSSGGSTYHHTMQSEFRTVLEQQAAYRQPNDASSHRRWDTTCRRMVQGRDKSVPSWLQPRGGSLLPNGKLLASHFLRGSMRWRSPALKFRFNEGVGGVVHNLLTAAP